MDQIQQGIHHFMHGFAFLQQFSKGFQFIEDTEFPYFIRGSKNYEFVVYKHPADEVMTNLNRINPSHSICFFPGDNTDVLQSYKTNGYRQRYTTYLMQFRVADFESSKPEITIRRATTEDELAKMSKAKGWGRKYEAEHLQNEEVYTMYAELDGEVIGGGNLVILEEDEASYSEDVFTVESHQGKGIGRALMHTMLGIAKEHGLTCNTLVAFASAQPFYDKLGYEVLSELKYVMKKK